MIGAKGECVNKLLFLIVLALGFVSYADENLKYPETPKYEECKDIAVQIGTGSSYYVRDTACLNRNAEAQRNYNAAVEAYNRAKQIINSDSTALNKPQEPKYDDCSANGSGFYNYSCLAANQAKQREYNLQMNAYNIAQQNQARHNQTAEEQKAAQLSSANAASSLAEVAQKNQNGAAKYSATSTITSVISAGFAAAFAASCAGAGTCNYYYLASSVGFALLSAQASKQAKTHQASAVTACAANAQLSGSTGNCDTGASTISDFNQNNPYSNLVPSTFDSNGNCTATDKSLCEKAIANLPPGTNIKDVLKGASNFASSPAFKFNKDGSITTKDGKTFKPEDFQDVKSMVAAGMSEGDAKSLMASLGKAGISPQQLAEDLKDSGKSGNDKTASLGDYGAGSGGTQTIKDDGKGPNGSLGLGSKDLAGGKSKRKPSATAEGLTRDFNGESIGAAGDDIFGMMNRRYKVKTSQDAFISK